MPKRLRTCELLAVVGLLLSVAAGFVTPGRGTSSPAASTTQRHSSSNPLGDAAELTSALARLDQQWQIQQSSKKSRSRWSKLVLPNDPDDDVVEETPLSSNGMAQPEDFVWLLEPPSNSIPSCIIVFTGGAGLGQFPQIAYNELLRRVSDRLNAAVIAAPYQIGLDHFGIAKQTGERLRRALLYCEDDPSRQYPTTIPTYSLAHSLGCKLQTIYMGATGQDFDGVGFMAFNNFSFGKTVSMARSFAEQIQKGMGRSGPSMPPGMMNEEVMNNIFSFAENLVGAIGVDFSPDSEATERLIQMRYDSDLQRKTRLFVFDEDDLDSSKEFIDSCSGSPGPSTSGLAGFHLSPVFFKLGLDDLEDVDDIPSEAREMTKEAIGGFQSASFGDEEALEGLVDEICSWVLGKGPTRSPDWDSEARNEVPRLAGFASEDS